MKNYILTVIISIISISVIAQSNGSIDKKALDKIRSSFNRDANFKAVNNAVTNGDIKKLALNRDNLGKNDHYFEFDPFS